MMSALLSLSVPTLDPLIVAVVVALAVLVGTVAVIYALPSGDNSKSLKAQLNDYAAERQSGGGTQGATLVESGVVQSAVDLTAKIGDRYGLVEKIEHKLEQADLPVRASEALFFYAASLAVAFVLVSVLTGNLLMGLIIAVFLAFGPIAYLDNRRRKRLKAFESALPDMLSMLAGTLRAGFSFTQGLETVANEAGEPMRRELQRAFTESKLGVPIEESLNEVADRMDSEDLRWAVLAIAIQREVGGNLAELLDTVAETMTQRERLRSEIKALTAEGRISGIVLGIFPFALAAVLYVMNPAYLSELWTSAIGIGMTLGSLILAGFGGVWLKKVVSIEV